MPDLDPLPMAPSCSLDEEGLRRQLERYRAVGRPARLVQRTRSRLVVDLGEEVDGALVERTIATERECCPFFTLEWSPDNGRLSVSVSAREHEPALEVIAFALGL